MNTNEHDDDDSDDSDDSDTSVVVIRLRIAEHDDSDAVDAVERVLDAGVLQDAINEDDDSDVEVLDAYIVYETPKTTETVASLLSQLNDAVICREAAQVDPAAVERLTRDLIAAVQFEAFTNAAQACAGVQTANECADACRALASATVSP